MRTLAFQLVTRGRVTTSEAKAKELAPIIERMVTRAKQNTVASRRLLLTRVPREAATKLANDIAPRMRERTGGYTRIIKLGPRKSDGSRRALVEFVT